MSMRITNRVDTSGSFYTSKEDSDKRYASVISNRRARAKDKENDVAPVEKTRREKSAPMRDSSYPNQKNDIEYLRCCFCN
jgi:hypothetical protein